MLSIWHHEHLGCSVLTLRTRCGAELTLMLWDGGGYVASTGAWKLAGRVLAMVVAGQA